MNKFDTKQHLAAVCWITTLTLLAFLCFTQLGVMLSLLMGHVGMAWVAPMALVLALVLGDRLGCRIKLPASERLWPPALALGTLAVSLAVSAWYFDLSWDGQWYHQTAVYALAGDWNTLTEPMRGFTSHLELYVRHYAKGPWYVAAAICNTIGQFECGKCTAIIAWVAMGLAVFAAGLDWGLRRRYAAAITAVIALNPVVMSELTTYLVDGILISFLVVVAAVMFSAFRRPQPVLVWVGILASILSINAKLTGLVFLCFVFAAGWVWCVAFHRPWLLRYTGLTALALVLGVAVFGYNPYVTNTIRVYPLRIRKG